MEFSPERTGRRSLRCPSCTFEVLHKSLVSMGCRCAAPILLSALACGCSALPSYGLKVNAPNKDVLHLVIYLKERAEPAVYQQIALQEVSRIHAERRQGPPLY